VGKGEPQDVEGDDEEEVELGDESEDEDVSSACPMPL
jgi:hypothetical protein